MTDRGQQLLDVFAKFLEKHPESAPGFERMAVRAQGRRDAGAELNSLWSRQEHILANLPGASRAFYEGHRHIRELEHQVGRFLNMREIADEIAARRIEGDIVEFGSWQGMGLLLLSRCFAHDSGQRNLIGIDSFEGLPETSTTWTQGQFNDTSLEGVRANVAAHKPPGQSFTLIKGWFGDQAVAETLWRTCRSVALVHFDADLGSSTTQALALIEPYLRNRTQPIFFLFDDWGCHPDEVPDAFLSWLEGARDRFKLRADKIASTNLTRYYRISFGPP